jgi:hypothetical protein
MFKKRPDGTLLADLPHFTRLLPYLMPGRNGSTIFFEQDFDVTETLRWLKSHNRALPPEQPKVTFFQVFLCGAVRAIALRPKMNRFVSGHRYWQRNRISVNFVAKKELTDEGEEINITIPFSPFETIHTLPSKVNHAIRSTMDSMSTAADDTNAFLVKLPRFLLRLVFWVLKKLDYYNVLPGSFMAEMPFYSTLFLTNVGSVGIDAPLHHNFELGTCGIFVALGTLRKARIPAPAGSAEPFLTRDQVRVTFTFDDRIVDGVYSGRTIALFKSLVEQPKALEQVPELSAALLAEHRLA